MIQGPETILVNISYDDAARTLSLRETLCVKKNHHINLCCHHINLCDHHINLCCHHNVRLLFYPDWNHCVTVVRGIKVIIKQHSQMDPAMIQGPDTILIKLCMHSTVTD